MERWTGSPTQRKHEPALPPSQRQDLAGIRGAGLLYLPSQPHSAEDSWRQARGYEGRRPGNPPYNVSRYVVFKHLVRDVDASTAQQLDEGLNKASSLVTELQPSRDEIADHAARVADLSARLANELNRMIFD